MAKKRQRKKRRGGFRGFLELYMREVRRYFVTGMLVWVPLITTIWICWFVLSKLGQVLEVAIQQAARVASTLLQRVGIDFPSHIDHGFAVGFAIAVAIFLSTGLVAKYLATQRIIALGEQILHRIPFISRVYRAVQQIRDVFITREGAVFQEVCLVEYPRKDCHAVAFVTNKERGLIQETVNKDLLAVFLPTTPNPTSGFLLYLPRKEVRFLNIGVEDAMKLIISGGAYVPTELVRRIDSEIDSESDPDDSLPGGRIPIAR